MKIFVIDINPATLPTVLGERHYFYLPFFNIPNSRFPTRSQDGEAWVGEGTMPSECLGCRQKTNFTGSGPPGLAG